MLHVLLDLHKWKCSDQHVQLTLEVFIRHILLFLRAYLLQKEGNNVSVFLVGKGGSILLGSTVPGFQPEWTTLGHPRDDLSDTVMKSLSHIVDNNQDVQKLVESPRWSAALVQALCHSQKVSKLEQLEDEARRTNPDRILCIVTSLDDTGHYLSFMNAIFAAQREKIAIDACILSNRDSSLFQQGCLMSKGFYLKPKKADVFLEYLMSLFTIDHRLREQIRFPSLRGVDFRASCFCHQRPVDLGYVCSVCLSVFCERQNTCLTCGSKFSD